MGNVADGQNEWRERELELRELAIHVKEDAPFFAYRAVFLDRLPEVAPAAMPEVMRLVPIARQEAILPQGTTDRERARQALLHEAYALCHGWGFVGDTWLPHAVFNTAMYAVHNEVFGLPAPGTIVGTLIPRAEVPERHAPKVESIPGELIAIDPYFETRLMINPSGRFYWEVLRESRAQFRRRAQEEYMQRLDAILDSIPSEFTALTPVKVNTRAVEWLILRTIGRQSEYAVNKQYFPGKDNRKLVHERVQETATILRLRPLAFEDDVGSR